MTRRDFELIANAIDAARTSVLHAGEPYDIHSVTLVAINLADALADTNARFDRLRFLRACGLEG